MDKSLKYPRISFRQFAVGINTESKARNLAWKFKFPEGFVCPKCSSRQYWQHKSNFEMRQCASCKSVVRLRTDTVFKNSKLPMLTWMQALYFVMQDKRGVSAVSLQRLLTVAPDFHLV